MMGQLLCLSKTSWQCIKLNGWLEKQLKHGKHGKKRKRERYVLNESIGKVWEMSSQANL